VGSPVGGDPINRWLAALSEFPKGEGGTPSHSPATREN
jgi:hypothetical protein